MADIIHYFVINAHAAKIFPVISTADGLSQWWTKGSDGEAAKGKTYSLDFGPGYQWEAVVTEISPNAFFELCMIKSDDDWRDSIVRFELKEMEVATQVKFFHSGWKSDNEHFRISNYCWAMYLRLLKQNVETGLFIPYDRRLEE